MLHNTQRSGTRISCPHITQLKNCCTYRKSYYVFFLLLSLIRKVHCNSSHLRTTEVLSMCARVKARLARLGYLDAVVVQHDSVQDHRLA